MAHAEVVDVDDSALSHRLQKPHGMHAAVLLDLWSSSDEEASHSIHSHELAPDTPSPAERLESRFPADSKSSLQRVHEDDTSEIVSHQSQTLLVRSRHAAAKHILPKSLLTQVHSRHKSTAPLRSQKRTAMNSVSSSQLARSSSPVFLHGPKTVSLLPHKKLPTRTPESSDSSTEEDSDNESKNITARKHNTYFKKKGNKAGVLKRASSLNWENSSGDAESVSVSVKDSTDTCNSYPGTQASWQSEREPKSCKLNRHLLIGRSSGSSSSSDSESLLSPAKSQRGKVQRTTVRTVPENFCENAATLETASSCHKHGEHLERPGRGKRELSRGEGQVQRAKRVRVSLTFSSVSSDSSSSSDSEVSESTCTKSDWSCFKSQENTLETVCRSKEYIKPRCGQQSTSPKRATKQKMVTLFGRTSSEDGEDTTEEDVQEVLDDQRDDTEDALASSVASGTFTIGKKPCSGSERDDSVILIDITQSAERGALAGHSRPKLKTNPLSKQRCGKNSEGLSPVFPVHLPTHKGLSGRFDDTCAPLFVNNLAVDGAFKTTHTNSSKAAKSSHHILGHIPKDVLSMSPVLETEGSQSGKLSSCAKQQINTAVVQDYSQCRSQSPVFGSQSQVISSQSPVIGSQSPVISSQSPVIGSQSPVISSQSPVFASPLPAMCSQMPVIGSHLPVSGSQLPVIGSQSTVISSYLPVCGSSSPALHVGFQSPVFGPTSAGSGSLEKRDGKFSSNQGKQSSHMSSEAKSSNSQGNTTATDVGNEFYFPTTSFEENHHQWLKEVPNTAHTETPATSGPSKNSVTIFNRSFFGNSQEEEESVCFPDAKDTGHLSCKEDCQQRLGQIPSPLEACNEGNPKSSLWPVGGRRRHKGLESKFRAMHSSHSQNAPHSTEDHHQQLGQMRGDIEIVLSSSSSGFDRTRHYGKGIKKKTFHQDAKQDRNQSFQRHKRSKGSPLIQSKGQVNNAHAQDRHVEEVRSQAITQQIHSASSQTTVNRTFPDSHLDVQVLDSLSSTQSSVRLPVKARQKARRSVHSEVSGNQGARQKRNNKFGRSTTVSQPDVQVVEKQGSRLDEKEPSERKTRTGRVVFSDSTDSTDIDVVELVRQLDEDEKMAKQLQEHFDAELARLTQQHNEIMSDVPQLLEPIAIPPPLPTLPHPPPLFPNPLTIIPPVPGRGQEMRWRDDLMDMNPVNASMMAEMGRFLNANTETQPGYGYRGRQRRGRARGRGRSRTRGHHQVEPDGNDYEQLWNLVERVGDVVSKGLPASSINLLPTFLYSSGQDSSEKECSICMGDYELGENMRRLPCFHFYHAACIDKWLKDNRICPVCREEVNFEAVNFT
ncbi:uncharacterized protein LOC110977989 isoform X2 [Acanthaster planci]|nr:uncharacterized protein LOC110977989 isoform X2 [Acanthaster planci]